MRVTFTCCSHGCVVLRRARVVWWCVSDCSVRSDPGSNPRSVEIYPYESHFTSLLLLFILLAYIIAYLTGDTPMLGHHQYSPDWLLSVVTTTFYQLRVSHSYTFSYSLTYPHCSYNRLWAPVSHTFNHIEHSAKG